VKWAHRSGVLHCLVVLPDRSTMFVPAEWTNVGADESKRVRVTGQLHSKSICIGSVSDLLQARTVVDALLHRLVCLDHAPSGSKCKEADGHPIEATASGREVGDTTGGMVSARPGREGGLRSSTRESDGQGNRGDTTGNKKRRSRR
jgi:hypothetical protein